MSLNTSLGSDKNTHSAEDSPQDGVGVIDRVQITAFDDDTAVLPERVPGEAVMPQHMNDQFEDDMIHSIISFLERPQLISVFAWKNMSLDKHGQNILAMMSPSDPTKTIINPLVPSQIMTQMILEKLQGFSSFRATAVFRLQVNSQPFQAGRLIFGAVPMPTLLLERADFIMKTPCSAISVNHVQLDINKVTEVTLRVPFISPFNSYDLINQQFDWARLFCIVYAPLNVVGSDNALDMQLWTHFEDIELGCPTSAKCTIQPAYNPTRVCYWGDTVQQQAGKVKNIIDLNKEKESKEKLLKKKEEKRQSKLRQYLQDYKVVQQSGVVPSFLKEFIPFEFDSTPVANYSKGLLAGYFSFGNSDNGKKYNLNLKPGIYWLEVYSLPANQYGNSVGFDTWRLGWSDSTQSFSGPINLTKDMLSFTIKQYNDGVGIYVYLFNVNSFSEDFKVSVTNSNLPVWVENKIDLNQDPLEVKVVNNNESPVPVSGESMKVSFDQPVWVTDHDQSYPNTPPAEVEEIQKLINTSVNSHDLVDELEKILVEQPVPENFVHTTVSEDEEKKNEPVRRRARQQSGKIPTRNIKKNTPRFSTKSVKKPLRVPPKEAAAKDVENQRQNESDGIFARGVKSFAGKVAGAVTSVADVVASVGNWLGWSKPILSHAGDTVVIRPTQYFANTNGIDHSHVLSLDLLNSVDVYPDLTGTDLDELSFDFVKRVPQFIGAFQYNQNSIITSNPNTGVGNDYLWSCFVTPNYLNPACFKYQYSGKFGDDTATADNILSIQNPTSLAYAISPFTYWTGSLVYTIRFAKTDFNSGRVEVSFHPFLYYNTFGSRKLPVPDNQRFEYAYKLVIDLRKNTEASFTIPYMSPQPWKALTYYNQQYFINPYSNPDGYSELFLNELSRCSTGLLWVRALTPLHTQSAVAPTSILAVVEVRAGDDFAVQCPSASRYIPIATSQAGRVYAVPGTQDTRTKALEGFQPPSITGSEYDIERESAEIFCAGEIFDNYRAFVKRNMFVRMLSQYRPNQSAIIRPVEYIAPSRFFLNIYQNKYDKKYYQIFKMQNWTSPLSFVSAMYTFYRGGTRFKIVPTTASGGILSVRLVQELYDGIPGLIAPTTNEINAYQTFNSAVHYEQNDKRICEFQVPYYSPTMQSVHWSKQGGYLFDNPLPHLEIGDSNVTSSLKTLSFFSIAASAADDFDLGLFLGAPLCVDTRLYGEEFDYKQDASTTAEADWFENGSAYDNVHKADPCHGVEPFNSGKPPADFDKISTTDLAFSLMQFSVSNPDLTTTSDPGKVFKLGC